MNITKGKVARPQRLVVYGQEGVGKTTLAAQLPAPLVLDTEGGSGQLDVDRVDVGNLTELGEALRDILRGCKDGSMHYCTIVLDTVDRIWNMAAEAVCAEKGYKSIEDAGYGKGLKMATEKFCAVITSLDKLVAAGLFVVCVCHSKVETLSLPDKEDFCVYQLKVSAPGKQAEESAAFLKQWADCVLFCQFNTLVNSESGKACAQKRVIRTAHGPCWEAKNRYGLPETLDMTPEGVAVLVGTVFGAPGVAGCERVAEAPTEAAAPAEEPAAEESSGGDPELDRWANDDTLLQGWLRATGKLGEKEELKDAKGALASALGNPKRRENALAMARLWAQEHGREA